MDGDSSPLNESALKLALEIMYLLTGEVYVIIKKLGNGASGGLPHESGWSLAENTLMVPSLYSAMYEKNNDEKVLDLTKKIIALLTREVPMRSQDVTVYFSVEEWEYLEEHKDLYKDVMMENHQTLTSVGGSSRRNTEPETNCRVPHYQELKKHYNGSHDPQLVLMDALTNSVAIKGAHSPSWEFWSWSHHLSDMPLMSQMNGVLKRIKVEVEDTYQISYPHPCKEEEVPTAICPEASSIRNTLEGCPINPYLMCKTEEDTDFFQRPPQSHQHPPRSESIFRDLMMYTERSHMTKKILELTMEIIYLLSRGEYVILKSSGEHVIPSGSIHAMTNQSSTQSSLMLPTPNSLTHELHNDQKILEVTNKLIELLTGEVSMRCQDVTVYFSLEEWEYFEEHKELYMRRFTSPGHRASQGLMKTALCRNPTQYGQQNIIQGDTDYSDSEETVSDSEDYEDDESQSDTETEDEVPLSKINDPDLQVLLNRLRKMVRESEDYNPQCFQNDPEWGPGF